MESDNTLTSNEHPDYLLSDQATMFGATDVTGFGTSTFRVQEIARDLANEIVSRNHYSRRIVSSSRIHLGVIIGGELLGVLQYGVAMNPQSMGSIMLGCGLYEYLELNRMWLDDRAPKNSESRAIACSIRFVRRK